MMRRFLHFSIVLAMLAVAPSANGLDELKLNQTYRDVIRLHFPAGKTQIPLPEGNWELLGLNNEISGGGGDIKMWSIYLARIEHDTLVGQIEIRLNNDLWDYGWLSVGYCDRDNLWFKEVKSNRDSDVDCWAVQRVRIKPERWREGRKQMLDNLLSRNVNVTIPQNMIMGVFFRASEDNFLRIIYYFHPYPLEGTPITREDIKTWGQKWKPKVDAGFLGKLKAFKAKKAPAPLK